MPNDDDRGKIRNRDHALQVKDFSGLRYGKITPTDIDLFLDFGNEIFIFAEAKYGDSILPLGQRLALERLVDACQEGGIRSYAFIVSHRAQNGEDIDMRKAIVREYRYKGKWTKERKHTLGYCIGKIREKNGLE